MKTNNPSTTYILLHSREQTRKKGIYSFLWTDNCIRKTGKEIERGEAGRGIGEERKIHLPVQRARQKWEKRKFRSDSG